MNLYQVTADFADALEDLRLPAGVSHAYNPLVYMWGAHQTYLSRYVDLVRDEDGEATVTRPRRYLILGMNPGPHGMVQTGVPFGDVVNARRILRDEGPSFAGTLAPNLGKGDAAAALHPARPVVGLGYYRRENSGERLWAGLSSIFGSLDATLAQCFAMNYCPLAYFAGDSQGTNVTPEEFVKSGKHRDREYAVQLDALCSPYLRKMIDAMRIEVVLAVGRYAERKAMVAGALRSAGSASSGGPSPKKLRVVYLTHPSPLATRSADEWAAMARREMKAAGVLPEVQP